MGEETITGTEAAPEIQAPPERLEARMTRAMDETSPAAPAGAASGTPDTGAPTLDGLPLETAAAPAQPDQGGWQSVRDYAKQNGVDLPYDNDAAALNALIAAQRQLQERNAYAELGQRLSPHIGDFQQYLQKRQAPPAEAPAWAPPPFKKEWLGQVERDEATGQLRVKPGFDPAVAERVQAYADWRDRFLDNPEQVVGPLVEQRAQDLIERKFAEHQQQTLAQQLVAQHSSWLYQRDASGRPVVDPASGQPRFSPAGVVYAQEARRVHQAGITDVRQMDYYARIAAENAALRGHLQQQRPAAQAPAPGTPASPSVGGHAGRPGNGPPSVPVSRKGLSLREQLQVALSGAPEDLSL